MYKFCSPNADAQEYRNVYCCILDRMIAGMTSATLNCSISHNFMVQMIPHHRAAIEMSQNILHYTQNETLWEIASQIIAEQTKSIENMESILCACTRLENPPEAVCRYQQRMNAIMNTMFTRMRRAKATRRVDCDFLREMIPHHMGAVEMASTTLQFDICPELVPILQAIITSQEKGIAQMEALASNLHCRC